MYYHVREREDRNFKCFKNAIKLRQQIVIFEFLFLFACQIIISWKAVKAVKQNLYVEVRKLH